MSSAISRGHKNLHKLSYYSRHAIHRLLPGVWLRARRESVLRQLETMEDQDRTRLLWRVDYCNRLEGAFMLPDDATRVREFRRDRSWAYYLDMLSVLRFFPRDRRFWYRFGDVTQVPDTPTFVKSRPVGGDNQCSVLLKLNGVRHYYVVHDRQPFDAKLGRVVWRGACHQPHRQRFIEAFYDHPLCDVGDVHRKAEGKPWHREFMSVAEQLQYKFILSIEGNDVATNLKWIMASNSLCFMTRPTFETWFMEGALEPGYHYVEVKSDYSNLDEKLEYYMRNPEEAKAIISNANNHVAQFMNHRRELLVSLLVMQKYFDKSGQL